MSMKMFGNFEFTLNDRTLVQFLLISPIQMDGIKKKFPIINVLQFSHNVYFIAMQTFRCKFHQVILFSKTGILNFLY